MSLSVPIKMLHEAQGQIITCEIVTGDIYRGKLVEVEDNMNCHITGVIATDMAGDVAYLENVYLRGSKIKFLILPDKLKNAPVLNKPFKGETAGRGKSAFLQAWEARRRDRSVNPAVLGPYPAICGPGRGINPAIREQRYVNLTLHGQSTSQGGPPQRGISLYDEWQMNYYPFCN